MANRSATCFDPSILPPLLEKLRAGQSAIWAIVVQTKGSAPRGTGAMMVVAAEGRLAGTIGGGAIEHEAERAALSLLSDRPARSLKRVFVLNSRQAADIGMVCGGEATVYLRAMNPDEPGLLGLLESLQSRVAARTACALRVELSEPETGAIEVGDLSAAASWEADAAARDGAWYIHRLDERGTVYVFGGGHVAQALVPVLAKLSFTCVVAEDRDAFLDPALFPGAQAVVRVDFQAISPAITLTATDYAVIMTRGHQHDTAIQAQALRTDALYIGVMGSRSKREAVNRALRGLGISEADLTRVHTPIGLPIRAETPEEIAVSIAAELIQVRAAYISSLHQ